MRPHTHVAGLVRRARRIADMSQREMKQHRGVPAPPWVEDGSF
jgi:hypothetical protein